MTEFLKTVHIFVKRDARQLMPAFWLLNTSIELQFVHNWLIVERQATMATFGELKPASTPTIKQHNRGYQKHCFRFRLFDFIIVIYFHLCTMAKIITKRVCVKWKLYNWYCMTISKLIMICNIRLIVLVDDAEQRYHYATNLIHKWDVVLNYCPFFVERNYGL